MCRSQVRLWIALFADLNRFQELLDRLEAHWHRVDAPVARLAKPGLSDEQIEEMTAGIDLRLPVEVRHWFRWHDGVDPSLASQATMGPSFYLPSLAQQVLMYLDEREFAREGLEEGWVESEEEIWKRTWFPVFNGAFGRAPVIVECDVPEGDAAPLGYVAKESVDTPVQSRTLTSLVEFWVECHDEGLYRWRAEDQGWQVERGRLDITGGPYSPFYM